MMGNTRNVELMWICPTGKCIELIKKNLRAKTREKDGIRKLADELSKLCDCFWDLWGQMSDKGSESKKSKIQAWHLIRAVRTVLMEYGWWNAEYKMPDNHLKEV